MQQPYGIKVVTPPAVEPLTVGRVRNHLRLDQTDDDDEIRDIWIPAARQLVEDDLGICLATQTVAVSLTRFPGIVPFDVVDPEEVGHSVTVELPIGPVQSVVSITYYDAHNALQTLDPAVYELDATRLVPGIRPIFNQVWPTVYPRQIGAVITVVAGFGADPATIPATLRAAMLLMIRNWYDGLEVGEMSSAARAMLDLNWSGGSSHASRG